MITSVCDLVRRNWLVANPPEFDKSTNPLVFGILGAADIAPMALILPIKTHPDVVLQTVAARSFEKAKVYAQKHGIPDVAMSYQEILDNPKIDAVYIPLPNGLHYEWAQRALKAGKHVLLEKPSVNNSNEATQLFLSASPDVANSPRPVLLEAAHYAFHPAWSAFMAHVTPSEVESAKACIWVPRWKFGGDDIRYNFELGGGAMMDLGAYTASALSRIFGSVADGCESCETGPGPDPADPRCDRWYRTRYHFPNGGIGEMEGDLKAPLNKLTPEIQVTHRPVVVSKPRASGVKIGDGEELVRTRKISFSNFVLPTYLHTITVNDHFEVKKIVSHSTPARPRKTWNTKKTIKAYTWRDADVNGTEDQAGEAYWTPYRYQLEQFVNKIRGRSTPQWVDGDDSITTSKMIDMAYETAKLPLRPTSEYK
ncbi:hypothetical protein GGR57DRAFT_264944 [Xylariaceae sp. FL1272]|nr:hypothetical protein GGR57DRAFT_264944 [Xylariaceae sp. FL1272]